MNKTSKKQLIELWKSEEQRVFTGWDFSYIDNRTREEALAWDYKAIVNTYLKPHMRLLDMGTGGGEFLLGLMHPHKLTEVTESYPPNVALCKEKLEPLGIVVHDIEDEGPLSMADEQYDLVINRHEYFDVKEVYRVLKPGGIFITQQVGAYNTYKFSAWLMDKARPFHQEYTLDYQVNKLELAGFECVTKHKCFPKLTFLDVGAFVYFAKIIEWEFPGFGVEQYADKLFELQSKIDELGQFQLEEHRYLIVARK